MAHLIHNVLPVPPRKIATISFDASVEKCIEIMAELDIGALVILDNDKHLIGVVTERDILRECIFKGLKPNTTKAGDIAFKKSTILSPNDVIERAMKAITETKRRYVLIQDKDELVAILSIGDILYHLLDERKREIEHLENYIYSH